MLASQLSLFSVLGTFAAQQPELTVLRTTPGKTAEAHDTISVTFDRPVAPNLAASLDPRRVVKIEPEVAGRLEWRDPVTIRFIPALPLDPGATYRVTVDAGVRAADGARLERSYRFSFRVQGPRVLDALPVNRFNKPRHLDPKAAFKVLVSGPADLRVAARLVSLSFDEACGPRRVAFRVTVQRRIAPSDGFWARRAGGRDTRRVLELMPNAPLPPACAGWLNIPDRIEDAAANQQQWAFHTYGPLQLVRVGCGGAREAEQYEYDEPGAPLPATGRVGDKCASGPLAIWLTTPVRGADVLRYVRVAPDVPFTVRDTSEVSDRWTLEGTFEPRRHYVVVVDSGLTDTFGQRLAARVTRGFTTPGFSPAIRYAYGRMLVERTGFRTLGVQHVNVDTLELVVAPVADSLEAGVLARPWGLGELWTRLEPAATTTRLPVSGRVDVPRITAVRLPVHDAARPNSPTLLAVRVQNPAATATEGYRPIALVQVTDLAVHARLGAETAAIWVTGVGDGQPRAGVHITLHDSQGRVRATGTTDAQGLARLTGLRPDTTDDDCDECFGGGFSGYVAARLGADRAVVGVSDYDYDLSPWQFNARAEWGRGREPRAAAAFTERGIYRPGEPVYAKAIVRDGPLGDLKTPTLGDSLRWLFHARDEGLLKDTTVALSGYGTAHQSITLAPDAPLGHYRVSLQRRLGAGWRTVTSARYRVAEYRPPEFLVDVAGDGNTRFAGESFTARVEARYLFGAPMARAAVQWHARLRSAGVWELDIPGTDGFHLGESGWWWEDGWWAPPRTSVIAMGEDTLDAAGRLAVSVPLGAPPKGRPAYATVEASVTDVNRQAVAGRTTVLVHPADFYLGARPRGTDYFWQAGVTRAIDLVAFRPDGRRVAGVALHGVLVRQEWHRARRERQGFVEEVGDWVHDTVGTCRVTTQIDPTPCTLRPPRAGSYVARFTARDTAGREALTSFHVWAIGPGDLPWNDENRFKMEVVPDRTRYAVGDTATILFVAPFTDAEAWVTVEREGVILERRLRITSGTTTLKLSITEAFVPNAFVSIILVRGRSAPPGPPDDPGRPTLRVGYAELRVTPGVKQLTVRVEPGRAEYRPGDTATVRVAVRDASGAGRQSEVTLWAVDEGVLALTGYKTPDPVDLLYQPRGLGMRLASTLTTVAAQMVEAEKGREPGGGGGLDADAVLRSRFQTTAFFLGSVVTDGGGNAVAKAKLPDNLTTFRVMAVAVTRGDRYGSGHSDMLVTRPLVARPAVPRFVRDGDAYYAGVVVNHRLGGTPTVRVQARVQGLALVDPAEKMAVLESGRGREVRFAFRGLPVDTAVYRFGVSSGPEADAVETRVPVRPSFHPRSFTAAGLLRDTATAEFLLPDPVDVERSRLELSFGTSPLAVIRGYHRHLKVYPYYCSEQVSSVALPLIALYRAQRAISAAGGRAGPPLVTGNPEREIQTAVDVLSRRQREDGGIGLWSAADWTTPWLSAHAGRVLLEARDAGAVVSDSVLERLARYLGGYLRTPQRLLVPVTSWYRDERYTLSERLGAADFLSRYGRPDVAAENVLLGQAPQMAWEDRVWLAELTARRRQHSAARALLDPVWRTVRVEGRRAVLPDSAETHFYFASSRRPLGRLLTATLAVEPEHPLVGPLVETLAQQSRARRLAWWNTQDYASTIYALLAYDGLRRSEGDRIVRVRGGRTVVLRGSAGAAGRDTSVALTGLVGADRSVRLSLDVDSGGSPVFYFLTVREVPAARPVKPADAGIQVERWYERFASAGAPIVAAREGDLVRVRLRITVPAERHFVVVDDALPAGLEAVDLSLRTTGALSPDRAPPEGGAGFYGRWDSGHWTPFEHRELRDERVVYFATVLWAGTYHVSYVARATSPGVFVRPPAHAEEMYNPSVHGRSDGGVFTVTARSP